MDVIDKGSSSTRLTLRDGRPKNAPTDVENQVSLYGCRHVTSESDGTCPSISCRNPHRSCSNDRTAVRPEATEIAQLIGFEQSQNSLTKI
jgi:hypothetical protein